MQVDSDLNVLVKRGEDRGLSLYAILNGLSPKIKLIISNEAQHNILPELRKQINDILDIGVRRTEFLIRANIVGEVIYCFDDIKLVTKKLSILLWPRDVLLLDRDLSFEITNQIRDIT